MFSHLEADGAAIRSLIASAQSDGALRRQFHQRFVAPRAQYVAGMLRRAMDENEVPRDTDLDTVTDMIHGAFCYPLLNDQPLDAVHAQALAAQILRLAQP